MIIYMDFLAWLTLLTIVLWIPAIVQHCWKWPQSKLTKWWAYQGKEYRAILLLVVIIRCCLIEAFRVPSGSMEPSLMTGDLILVNRFTYGIHLPFTNQRVVDLGQPARGDIAVFHSPEQPKIDMVKRIIGLPGDRLDIDGSKLSINHHQVKWLKLRSGQYIDELDRNWPTTVWQEQLKGLNHTVQTIAFFNEPPSYHGTIPAGQYFAMGDNRNASSDSRYWGFIPEQDFLGRVIMILGSWDMHAHHFRTPRFLLKVAGGHVA